MDISVRRLNHRLALQLPKELPLGLVFVTGLVGVVEKPVVVATEDERQQKHIAFELLEEGYNLRCLLIQSAENPTTVWEGEKVRVGGHLTFDPRQADYFLMTHDVEIIFEEEDVEPLFSEDSLALVHEQEALAAALAGVKRRSQSVAQLESAELPIWVKKSRHWNCKRSWVLTQMSQIQTVELKFHMTLVNRQLCYQMKWSLIWPTRWTGTKMLRLHPVCFLIM